MDNARLFLFFALALVLMLIWQAWEQHNTPRTPPSSPTTQAPSTLPTAVPSAPSAVPVAPGAPAKAAGDALVRGDRISVRTDMFRAVIDTQGGDLRELALLKYPVAVNKPQEPFVLLRDGGPESFFVQSGLIGLEGQYPSHKTRWSATATSYELHADAKELRVPLSWRDPEGARYTKTYVFRRGSYVVDVAFQVENTTRKPWRGFLYTQLQRGHSDSRSVFDTTPTYTGGAIFSAEKQYEKISLEDMGSKPLKREVSGGWGAMLQHYFVGAWLPPAQERNEFYSDRQDNRGVLGYKNLVATEIAASQSGVLHTRLYLGPKEQRRLELLACADGDLAAVDCAKQTGGKTYSEGTDLTVDYGLLTLISAPLFWILDGIFRFVGNWGWAIIILTILIKIAFYPLSAASYKSMAHMKKMQPKMQVLKERYGEDRQKLNQAMMELYKTEKINPLGGCLPILIQIPVFIALYWVLLESVEMRQAPWVLWIKDLSAQDPYYVLPIIMGVSMYAQQKLNPQPVDPVQQKIFMFMPLFFTVFFLFFPAGLVLYWTVNNILSIAQQWQINRTIGAAAK